MRIAESVGGSRVYTATSGEHIVIRDIFLSGGAEVSLDFSECGDVLVLPVVGAPLMHYMGSDFAITTGEVLSVGDGRMFTASNPFIGETINFLHITIVCSSRIPEHVSSITSLDIAAKNCLISGDRFAQNIRLGVYDSRRDDIAKIAKDQQLLVYVINGSFEVEGRLMEHRDGLLLWDRGEVEFEALSEAAIILLIEF